MVLDLISSFQNLGKFSANSVSFRSMTFCRKWKIISSKDTWLPDSNLVVSWISFKSLKSLTETFFSSPSSGSTSGAQYSLKKATSLLERSGLLISFSYLA